MTDPQQLAEIFAYGERVLPGAIVFAVGRNGDGGYFTTAPICSPNGVWNPTHGGKKLSTGLGPVPASEGQFFFVKPGFEKIVEEQTRTAFGGVPRESIIPKDQLNPQADNVPKGRTVVPQM